MIVSREWRWRGVRSQVLGELSKRGVKAAVETTDMPVVAETVAQLSVEAAEERLLGQLEVEKGLAEKNCLKCWSCWRLCWAAATNLSLLSLDDIRLRVGEAD